MSRYQHLLESISINGGNKTFGLFPFNSIIDPNLTDIHSGKIEFDQVAVEGLKKLAGKGYSVVVFINQFKGRPLSLDHFQSLNTAVEKFIISIGMQVQGFYWCPGVDKKDPFVVPNPGMFHRATENQGIKWEGIPVVSTSDNDLTAAEKVNATPIKIGNGSKWTHYNNLIDWTNSLS